MLLLLTLLSLWTTTKSFSQEQACLSDGKECVLLASFCTGEWYCEAKRGRCEQRNPQFDPCIFIRERARKQNLSLSVVCSDEVRRCILLHYCLSNDDCPGKVECLKGECLIVTVAESIVTQESSPSFLLWLIGIFTLIGALIVCLLLIMILKQAREDLANRKALFNTFYS